MAGKPESKDFNAGRLARDPAFAPMLPASDPWGTVGAGPPRGTCRGWGRQSLPRLCPKSHEMLREDFEQGAGRDWLYCGLLWPLHGFSRPPMRWLLLHSSGLDSKGKYKMKGPPTQTREKKPAPHHGTTRAEQVVSRCSSVSP